jgi:predicted nucleic acid-binding protein
MAVRLLGDGRDYTTPPTVILELAWVLGSYGIAKTEITKSLRALLGLANFKPSQSAEIAVAVAMCEAGLDFADALHLALSDGNDTLLTFDERFVGRAQQLGTTPPVRAVR